MISSPPSLCSTVGTRFRSTSWKENRCSRNVSSFLLFFFILTEMLPTSAPFLATAYRIETFIWPCNFFHMLILDRPVGTVSNHLFVLSSFSCLFCFFWLLCVVCLNRRIPAGSRGTTGRLPIWLINQSINPLMCFFLLQWSIMRTSSVSGRITSREASI